MTVGNRNGKHLYAVIIGRFQPFHVGHLYLLKQAQQLSDRLIVVVDSCSASRSIHSPLDAATRVHTLETILKDTLGLKRKNFDVVEVEDHLYNPALWVTKVQGEVERISRECDDIVLVVGDKGNPRDYQLDRKFPKWRVETVPLFQQDNIPVQSSDIRQKLFSMMYEEDRGYFVTFDAPWNALPFPPHDTFDHYLRAALPQPSHRDLVNTLLEPDTFLPNATYRALIREHFLISETRDPVKSVIHAVVMSSGYVLLNRVKDEIGEGLYTLPEVPVHSTTMEDSLVDLISNNIGLGVQRDLLKRVYLREQKVFDSLQRSLRGRIISNSFFFDLGEGKLPSIRPLEGTEWVGIDWVLRHQNQLFEDHASIIKYFLYRR